MIPGYNYGGVLPVPTNSQHNQNNVIRQPQGPYNPKHRSNSPAAANKNRSNSPAQKNNSSNMPQNLSQIPQNLSQSTLPPPFIPMSAYQMPAYPAYPVPVPEVAAIQPHVISQQIEYYFSEHNLNNDFYSGFDKM